MNIKRKIKFCVIWISSATIAKWIRLKYLPVKICTLTLLLKSGWSIFTSSVKIVFAWTIVLSSHCQIFIKKLSEIEVKKKDVKIFLTFYMIFKIFFQNYSLSVINAHWSLARRLRGREWGLGESPGFSYQLGWFSTIFIAQISWFTLENLVILKKRSRF